MNCKKCNTEMMAFTEGSTCGVKCPNCGYNIVTSCLANNELPEENYTIMVGTIDEPQVSVLKMIANICRCNYLEAKKKLKSGLEFKGLTAYEAQMILQQLRSEDMHYTIKPVHSE